MNYCWPENSAIQKLPINTIINYHARKCSVAHYSSQGISDWGLATGIVMGRAKTADRWWRPIIANRDRQTSIPSHLPPWPACPQHRSDRCFHCQQDPPARKGPHTPGLKQSPETLLFSFYILCNPWSIKAVWLRSFGKQSTCQNSTFIYSKTTNKKPYQQQTLLWEIVAYSCNSGSTLEQIGLNHQNCFWQKRAFKGQKHMGWQHRDEQCMYLLQSHCGAWLEKVSHDWSFWFRV